MYENYTRQALPSKRYRELLGSALCVFNSNNAFIIENILHLDDNSQYDWYHLIDLESGNLTLPIKNTITKKPSCINKSIIISYKSKTTILKS
jgi:hypothetical protein